jgi:ribosome biogenesis GTPase
LADNTLRYFPLKDKIAKIQFGMRKDSERRARKLNTRGERDFADTIPISIDEHASDTGIVVATTRSGCSVLDHDLVHNIPLESIRPGKDVVVGDNVVIHRIGDGTAIKSVLPRSSYLGRKDPRVPERVRILAANIDIVVVVVPAIATGVRSRLVDRLLIAAQSGGAQGLVCVTKIDLLDRESRAVLDRSLEPYRQIGIITLLTSAVTGESVAELQYHLQGKLSVLVGQSGVGKSSVLNALNPVFSIQVRDVREIDGKGRHTTTTSRAYRLDQNTLVIDTPGIRQIGLIGIDSKDLKRYFPEFNGYDLVCRYSDCSHTHEPDCGVKLAVRDGHVPIPRYESYRKLAVELGVVTDSDQPGVSITDQSAESKTGSFQCIHCGTEVPMEAPGTDHRNHCPRCLWSKHLDRVPGDRLACCGASMEPVAVWVRSSGEWAIIHRCSQCGHLSSNRIAADDNEMLLLSLAVRPISKPPFPLDTLG